MIYKIIQYCLLLYYVFIYVCKHSFVFYINSDSRYLRKILITKVPTNNSNQYMQPYQRLLRLIDRIISFIFPNISCLIKSLVKRDILRKYGHLAVINIGVIVEQDVLKAHAWLLGESSKNYKILYQVS